jgi:hypothetical protein
MNCEPVLEVECCCVDTLSTLERLKFSSRPDLRGAGMFIRQIQNMLSVNPSTLLASNASRLFDVSLRLSLAVFALLLFSTVADARESAAQYVRPFGPDAPWNVPVKNLPRHPQTATYASRMYNNAPDKAGNFNMSFVDYTYPVYYADAATGNYTVNGGNSTINGKQMPWNPAWSAAGGSDAQVIVVDPATGREWDLWQVTVSGSTINVSNGSLIGAGESSSSSGGVGNYRTKENGWAPSRGVGIQYLAMLVRPEEISQGEIKHALSLPVSNPSKTTYVAPATKLEHSGSDSGNEIPEGMRFALDVTDAQIESWVATKPAAYQKLARTVARALRDYGWFVTDTSGAAHFQFEAQASADALWKAQGIDPASSTAENLLDGLITQSRIYTIVPSDQYPNQSLAPPNPPSGLSVN